MDVELLPIIMLIAGFTLLYSAATNVQPVGLIQAALSGGDIATVAPIYVPGQGVSLNDPLPEILGGGNDTNGDGRLNGDEIGPPGKRVGEIAPKNVSYRPNVPFGNRAV